MNNWSTVLVLVSCVGVGAMMGVAFMNLLPRVCCPLG